MSEDIADLNEKALDLESRLFGLDPEAEAEDREALRRKVADILKAPNTRQGAEDAIMAAAAETGERALQRVARLSALVMLLIRRTGQDVAELCDVLDKMDDELDARPDAG